MTARKSKLTLVVASAIPLAIALLGIEFNWSMIETMLIVLTLSYPLSCYLVVVGGRYGVGNLLLLLWSVLFLLFVPFSNLAFTLIHIVFAKTPISTRGDAK